MTPSGTFQIINRRKDPIWYSSKGQIPPRSPENLLGAYWLGLSEPGIGIHGRPDTGPLAFDSRPTNGCVSLKNSDLKALYLISSIGTPVRIGDRLLGVKG